MGNHYYKSDCQNIFQGLMKLTPERTPELIKKFYFNLNWLLAVKLKVMMTIELCILN